VGLDNAKMVLMESLVYTKEFTDFFGNAFPPWQGLLLYGAPGNGKTLLGNYCLTCNFKFFLPFRLEVLIQKRCQFFL